MKDEYSIERRWGRKKAKKDHLELYEHARTIDPGFDLTKFRNVWTALRKV